MSVGIIVQFPGTSLAKYDAVVKDVGLTADKSTWPEGALSHIAGASPNGLCVVDVWESQAHFERFLASRLKPGLAKHGLPQPQVTVFPIHNEFRR
jgi:hypothetical protein